MVAILSTRTGGRATLARAFGLDRRARHRTIGTEYATIARLRLRAAASAFVEEPTCIGRPGLRFRDGAVRTGDSRLKEHRITTAYYILGHVQLLLLVSQLAPRCFHPHIDKFCLLVFGALSKKGAVFRSIAIYINQTHVA
jgi:hypothetical protein